AGESSQPARRRPARLGGAGRWGAGIGEVGGLAAGGAGRASRGASAGSQGGSWGSPNRAGGRGSPGGLLSDFPAGSGSRRVRREPAHGRVGSAGDLPAGAGTAAAAGAAALGRPA